jgi:hypothetical protein
MKNSSLSTSNVTLITAIYLNLSYKDNLALNIKQGCWWTIKSLIVFISFRFLYLLFSMLSRRSCVLRDIFFPTYSYIFFQWKIFQICPQDFRLFIPPLSVVRIEPGNTKGGSITVLLTWFGISCMTTENFCFFICKTD